MRRRSRKVIFVIFLVVFFISAPAVVLYTAGYRYDFGTGRIVQTGILSVSSTPKGAQILMDGTATGFSSPAVIKNVLPGDHRIRLEKTGYSSWEKVLPVTSRSTTFADDVVLFVEAEPALVRETPLFATGINDSNGRAAYVRTEGEWTEVWTLDPATNADTLISRLPASRNQDVSVDWPFETSVLSIRVSENDKPLVQYVDADTGAAVEQPDSGIDLSMLDDRVAVSHRDGDTNVVLAYVPLGTYETHPSPEGIITLVDVIRGRVILIRSQGGDQPILLNANASFWKWEPNGSRLLYSDGFDLHVYDAAAHSDLTVTRLSYAITGVAWDPGHAIVLYAHEDGIYAVELDRRGERNTVRLASGSNLGVMNVHRSTLYFFGTVNGKSGLFARPLER